MLRKQAVSWKDPIAGIPVHRRRHTRGQDGVSIHYTAYGKGEPAIVCCNGVGVSTFFWKYVVKHFAPKQRVVTWDYRGHALSGLPKQMIGENFSMTNNARDLAAVLDDAGVDKAVLLGHSMGCQVIFEFWRLFPERVAGLVPICGPYGNPLESFVLPEVVARPLFETLQSLVEAYPREVDLVLRPLLQSRLPYEMARTGLINSQLAAYEDMKPYFEHLSEIDLRVFFFMGFEMQKHTAKPWLHKITAPALVVAGEDDLFTPMSLSEEMVETIPDAELLKLPRGSHAALIEHPELLNLRLEKWIATKVKGKSRKGPAARNAAPLPRTKTRQIRRPPV